MLTAAVARRDHIEDVSTVAVGQEHGLGRNQVARLLDRARATGLVQISIPTAGAVALDSPDRLRATCGLKHAVVVNRARDPTSGWRGRAP